MEAAGGIGLMLGPLMGAELYTLGGFPAPFLVLGFVLILLLLLIGQVIPWKRYNQKKGEILTSVSMVTMLNFPQIFLVFIIGFSALMSVTFVDATISLHLHEVYSFSYTQVGMIFSIYAIAYAIAAPLVGWSLKTFLSSLHSICAGLLFGSMSLLALGSPIGFLIKSDYSLFLKGLSLATLGFAAALLIIPVMPFMRRISESTLNMKHLFDDNTEFYQEGDEEASKFLEGKRDKEMERLKESLSISVASLGTASSSLGAVCGPIIGSALTEKFSFTIAAVSFSSILCFLFFILICFRPFARVSLLPIGKGKSDILDDDL